MRDRLRRLNLLSPLLAFPALWVFGAALAQIHVLDVQSEWSTMTWIVVVMVPMAFVCGGAIGRELVLLRLLEPRQARLARGSTRQLRTLLLALVVVGWLELVHQFISAGVVPLLAGDIDGARTSLPGGPTIALTNCLTIAAVVALAVPRRLLSGESAFELAVAGVALLGFALAGGRGTVVLPIIVALLARWAYWGRPSGSVVGVGGVLVLAFLSLMFYVRTAQGTLEPFDRELYGSVVPDTPRPLVPLIPIHLGLAMNFEALAHIVDHFPRGAPFGHGAYNALGLDIIFSSAQDVSSVSAALTPPWLTSTLAGPLWADGGLVLVTAGLLFVGGAATASHVVAQRTGELRHALLFGYVFYLTLFGVYQNLWTQHMDWVVVTAGLVLVGAIATDPINPPGCAGALFRGRVVLSRLGRATARRWHLVAAATAVVIVISIAAVLAASDVGVDSVRDTQAVRGQLAREITLPMSAQSISPAARLLTDGDAPTDNEPLYVVEARPRQLDVERFQRIGKRRLERQRLSLDVAPRRARTTYDISRWTIDRNSVLFSMSESDTAVDVRGVIPNLPTNPVVTGRALVPSRQPGTVRSLAIARWSGARPDLFVIEHGSPMSRVDISVYSGESRFARRIVKFKAPLRGLDPKRWVVDVGRVTGSRPDLVLVTRNGSDSHAEVHVLDGDSRYQSFLLQRPLPLPVGLPDSYRFVFGSSLGFASVYGIDLRQSGRPKLSYFLLPGTA